MPMQVVLWNPAKMAATKPALKSAGMRHLALRVRNLEQALWFYRDLLGFRIVWQPDADNVYLTSGCDNLALHRADAVQHENGALDHLGIIVATAGEVGQAESALAKAGVEIRQATREHRDRSVSCYVADPDGNSVQILFEPAISPQELAVPSR